MALAHPRHYDIAEALQALYRCVCVATLLMFLGTGGPPAPYLYMALAHPKQP